MTWNPGPDYRPRQHDWTPEQPTTSPEPVDEPSVPVGGFGEESSRWSAQPAPYPGQADYSESPDYSERAGYSESDENVVGQGCAPTEPVRTRPWLGRGLKVLLGILAALIVLLIVAMIAVPRVLYGGNQADRRLTVSGDTSSWLQNGYAAGFTALKMDGTTLVAVSGDGSYAVTSQTDSAQGRTELRGYSLAQAQETWSREGLSCSIHSAVGNTLHCFGLTPMDTKLYLVDMTTGQDIRTVELSIQPSSLEVMGESDGLLISRVSIETGGVLFSIPSGDGAAVQPWSTPIPASMSRCELLDGAVGCRTSTGDRFMILDAATGAIQVGETAVSAELSLLTWLADGFAITQSGSGLDARNQVQLFDLDANPVGTVRHATVPGFPDGLRGRAHYTLADLQTKGEILLVDAQGGVVASRPRPGADPRYQPGNHRAEQGAMPQAVSADGSVVLEWVGMSSWRLVDRQGSPLHPVDAASQVIVSNGYLAYEEPGVGVLVLLPAA